MSFLAFLITGCGGEDTAPGEGAATLTLSSGVTELPADGASATSIVAVVTDSNGTAVKESTSVTFKTTLGTFSNGKKEYKAETGITGREEEDKDDQVSTGTVSVQLVTGTVTGNAEVSAECNGFQQKIEIRFYDPHKIGTIALSAGNASIMADGVSQVAVIATVNDADGNPEPGITVSFKTSLGQFYVANPIDPSIKYKNTTAVTDVDGEAVVMLISGKAIGTANILGSVKGMNATASVTFTAGEPFKLDLRAAPSTVKPEGSSDIIATLFDIHDNPIAGQTIVFSTQINMSEGSLDSLSAPTDINGEAKVFYSAGKVAGADVIQARLASDAGMNNITTVVVDPGAIVIGGITVTAGYSSLVADGVSKVNIRAVVTDIDGKPANGKTVNFSTTSGTLQPTSDPTDDGYAEVMLLSSTFAGPATVTAECDGFIDQVEIQFIPGPAADDHIRLFLLPDTVPPGGTTNMAAIVMDQYNNRLDDQRVTFLIREDGGDGTVLDSKEMTPDQAEDSVYQTSLTAGYTDQNGDYFDLEIEARVSNGKNAKKVLTVDEDAIVIGSINVIAGFESIKADGQDSVTIQATVLDNLNQPAQGITVNFETTLGSIPTQETTDLNGIAEVTLRSGTIWGISTVTADANGFKDQVKVQFTSGKPSGVSLTRLPTTVLPGGQSMIYAELYSSGDPVAGETLNFYIYDNNTNSMLSSKQQITDVNGLATVTYTAGVLEGTDRISVHAASDSSITETTYVRVQIPSGTVGYIILTSDDNSIPNDGSSTAIRATIYDTTGNPMPEGTSITFKTTLGKFPGGSDPDGAGPINSQYTTPTADDSGIVITSLISEGDGGVAEIKATHDTVTQIRKIIIYDPALNVGQITITSSEDSLPPDGTSSAAITVIVRDNDGNLVPAGTLVMLETSLGTFPDGTLTQIELYTAGSSGTVITTLIASNGTSGTAKVTATAGGGSNSIYIDMGAEAPPVISNLTLAAEPDSIPADGTTQTLITANVIAAGGETVPDGTLVEFSIQEGGGSFAFGTTVTTISAGTIDADAFVTLTSGATPETATIRATISGKIAEIDIIYTAGDVQVAIVPNTLLATGSEDPAEITVTIINAGGSEVVGGDVSVSVDDLSLGTITDPPFGFATTDSNGQAEFEFTGKTKGGTATVAATWDPDGTPDNGDEVTGTATIDILNPPRALQVAPGYPDPLALAIDGTGGTTTSLIVCNVTDSFGDPVSDGYRFDFEIISGPNGGEFINPTTSYTADGQITTYLNSGTKSGPVSIKVTYFFNQTIDLVIDQITISTGPPVGEEFGVFAQYLNISGLWLANIEDQITVNVGDVYGNAVPDGTAVNFKTYNTGGFFTPSSANTSGGLASNILHSSGTYTQPQGFAMVTAEANNGGRTTHVRTIAVTQDPDHQNILYAGTDGGGVYKSINYGDSWNNVSRSFEQGKEGQNYIDPFINDLCIDPDDHNTVYAATGFLGRGNIYRSVDGGITWRSDDYEEWNGLLERLLQPPCFSWGFTNAVLSVTCDDGDSDFIWAGTDGLGAIFAKDIDGDVDEGFQWGGEVSVPAFTGTGVGTMSSSRYESDPDNIIIYPLPDLSVTSKTETWTATYEITGGAVSNIVFHENADSQANGTLAPIEATGVEDVEDETWTLTYKGDWTAPSYDFATSATTGTLTVTSIGKNTVDETWTLRYQGGTNEDWLVIGSVSGLQATKAKTEVNYAIPDKLRFYILSDGNAFQVGDEITFDTFADNWTVVGGVSGSSADTKTGVAYTTDGDEVTFTINGGTNFYRVDDEWTFATTPTGEWNVEGTESGLQANVAQNNMPYASDNCEVAFTIYEFGTTDTTRYVKDDKWEFHVTESGLGYGKIVRDIVKAPGYGFGNGATLYAATATGVYKTTNGGKLWSQYDATDYPSSPGRFTGDNITCILVHPEDPDVIYVGTEDAGVWYSTDAGMSWNSHNGGLGGGLTASIPKADNANTGDGVMSDVTVDSSAETENWTVTCSTAVADGGVFDINGTVSGDLGTYTFGTTDPDGTFSATVPFDFVISAGIMDFEVGDFFTFRTTRDPGKTIKDIAVDTGNDYLYALTYFFGELEPYAVGNVYSAPVYDSGTVGKPASDWAMANNGLPEYNPPADTNLFPQHAIAIDNSADPDALYIGGEGINFYKAPADLSSFASGTPQWQDSTTGMTNLIMSRMPVLFTDICDMEILEDYDENTDVYTYVMYVQDRYGNPPIVGSVFTVVYDPNCLLCANVTLLSVDYPDTFVHQGTWSDPDDLKTNIPYIINFTPVYPGDALIFTFTPLCNEDGTAPGCSGVEQIVTKVFP